MRLRQSELSLELRPHWGHTLAASIVLVLTLALGGVLFLGPRQPGKSYGTAYVLFTLQTVALVVWLSYPLWGGERVEFVDGFLRTTRRRGGGTSREIAIAELRAFEVASGAKGCQVVAVKTSGGRVELELAVGNPLRVRTDGAPNPRLYREECEEIARNLSELLVVARQGHGTYR